MRTRYIPFTEHDWMNHYQRGGFVVGFRGDRFQRGAGLGNILKGLFRAVLPLAKSAGKQIGKQLLDSGQRLATDLAAGENFTTSLEKRGRETLGQLVEKGGQRLARKIQTGEGLGKRINSRKKKRNQRRHDYLGRL